jgi:hypothetical protein
MTNEEQDALITKLIAGQTYDISVTLANHPDPWVEKCRAYHAALVEIIPVRTHRSKFVRQRRLAFKNAKRGQIKYAKRHALNAGADPEQLAAIEALIFDGEVSPNDDGELLLNPSFTGSGAWASSPPSAFDPDMWSTHIFDAHDSNPEG